MESVLSRHKIEKKYWQGHVNNITEFPFLNFYLVHIRDAKRFVNNLTLRYSLIHKNVNFEQFCLLELIRYKSPKFFKVIYENGPVLMSQLNRGDDAFIFEHGTLKPSFGLLSEIQKEPPEIQSTLKELAKYRNAVNIISKEFNFFELFHSEPHK